MELQGQVRYALTYEFCSSTITGTVSMSSKQTARCSLTTNELTSFTSKLIEHTPTLLACLIRTTGCRWRVPRNKLLPSFVKELVLRCPNAVHVDYLRDADTTDVVWLDDVQLQCKPAPWEWTVVAKEQRVLVDDACNPHYQGL
jgi:hypothetical protein